eukprot:TRINITY_DN334_c1_g1_i5.p1 TRINITY_DN334_c1_g1~~TRINITY_DN334_c1_g1_i5.p1  ORF type:complete len:525 (-),score=84.11 TRINITY_DN334_c1_g1_i5:201-1775(-)
MDEQGAILVRAPPQSGKTSLLQLVGDKLTSMHSKVYYVSLGQYDPAKQESFERVWAEYNPAVDFNNIVVTPQTSPESENKPAPPPQPVYLLVDEAQKAFPTLGLALFKKLKDIQSGRSKSGLRILLVSCWGSKRIKATTAAGSAFSTPGSWDNQTTIGLWREPESSGLDIALQFTFDEAQEYWAGWLAANGWSGYAADSERNYLFVITQRQPGALSLLLDRIKDLGLQPSRATETEWHEKVRAWLLGENLIKAVADLRSMSMLADAFDQGITGAVPGSDDVPAVAVKDLVRKLLHGGELKVHSSQLIRFADEYDAALTLTRLGQLILEQEFFYLPSILHMRYMTRQLYLGRNQDANAILEARIFEFVVVVVERLDPVQLRKSDSRHSAESALYERQFQNSFYQAAMSYLPHDAILSPDVGYLYGAEGYLDFLLGHPFAWGFELLREGDRRREHLARFASGGKYFPLLNANAVKQWVVLDFCWKRGAFPPEIPHGFVHVSFSDNFTQAVVTASDKQKIVELRGLR